MTGLFILDLERLNHSAGHWDQMPEYSEAWGGKLGWWVCPECLWLTPTYNPHPICLRPAGVSVRYGNSVAEMGRACGDVRTPPPSMLRLPDSTADALWSALALGGVNSVVAMVGNFRPEQFGLATAVQKWRARHAAR